MARCLERALDISAAALAATLGIPPGPQDTPEQICRAIRRRLSGGTHLLILDNLEQPNRLEDFLLPPPSRVLITTRLRSLGTAHVNECPISVLEPPESIALLRKHRDDLTGPEHEEALGRIADHFGHHALAVTLAAAYLRKHRAASLAEVLERLTATDLGEKKHLFEKLDPAEHTAGYRLKVAASLGLHLPEFRDTPAMGLLAIAAFCHPDRIPVELFHDPPQLSQEIVDDWLVKLDDVSIIHYDGKTVSIHRLMQEIIRVEIGAERQREVLQTLVNRLGKRFEDALDYRNWAMQDAYAAHAETAVDHAQQIGGISRSGFLANQLGEYFHNRARFDPALAALRTAEGIDRAAYGDEHPNVACDVNNIGSVLKAKGDLDGALECFRKAERIDRGAYGGEHPAVATVVNNIGDALQDKGDLDGALECYREAERIDRAAYGDEHPGLATDVNNIGDVFRMKGDLHRALEFFREAERIDRAAYGDEHPEVATHVANIGDVLRVKGHLDEALECFREAERIDRAAYRDEHPSVAMDVNNIGSVLLAKGDHDGAREMMSEAFRIKLTTIGPRALSTITTAGWLPSLDLDPIALAREIAGPAAAEELRAAMGGD